MKIGKIAGVLLALLLALQACACNPFAGTKESTEPPNGESGAAAGEGTDYRTFIEFMRGVKGFGDQMAERDMPVQSAYFYSFAGASVSAMRYAVEYILWLKGEGDTLASFTADSRYTGWEQIAEINYSSPYPSYFEGLLYEIQGKRDECIDPYAYAMMMPAYPEEGLDFYYFKKTDVETLYDIRSSLRALEEEIYADYRPDVSGRAWDRFYFDAPYLLDLAGKAFEAGDYQTAYDYAKLSLKADPFVAESWRSAALAALYADDLTQLGAYMDEALAVFPDDENLNNIKNALYDVVSEMEAEE